MGGVEVRHLVVHVDKLLILSNDSALWLGIIVYGGVGGDLAKSCVLNTTQDILIEE